MINEPYPDNVEYVQWNVNDFYLFVKSLFVLLVCVSGHKGLQDNSMNAFSVIHYDAAMYGS